MIDSPMPPEIPVPPDLPVPTEIRDAAERLLIRCGKGPLSSIHPLTGGRNNRVFRVQGATPAAGILKHYFRGPAEKRDRFASEVAWYHFCEAAGISCVPKLWGSDESSASILIAEIHGRRLASGEVTIAHVSQAMDFFAAVNRHRQASFAAALPPAADACFTVDAYLAGLDARIARFKRVTPDDEVSQQLHDWLSGPLMRVWSLVRQDVERTFAPAQSSRVLADAERCLSPSDFGFHNAILDAAGQLWFVDFEYAGWDDPAKTVCDFFWQVDVPAPRDAMPLVLAAVRPFAGDITRRVDALFPLLGLQWATIVLNEFLRDGQSRRHFALGNVSGEDARLRQLQIARRLVDDVQHLLDAPAGD